MTDWVALATACTLGFLHALEVDHMLAVTAFVSRRPALGTAARFGFRWGVGHSLAVLLAGGALLVSGVRWPERYDAIGEAVVGLMLIGLGAWAIVSSRKLHLHPVEEHGGHAHLHLHGPAAAGHDHPHRLGEAAGAHEHGGITLVGLMHGLAGTSAVVTLVPVTLLHRVPVGLGYLTAFGIGVTLAMTLFAAVAAAAMHQAAVRSLVWGRRAAAGIGVAGIVVGIGWVLRAA